MKFRTLFLFLFIFIFFVFLLNNVKAFSFGISPNELLFTKESQIALINPNNFPIKFNISGCDKEVIDFISAGEIRPKETRILNILKNEEMQNKDFDCNLTVLFENNGHVSGGNIPIKTKALETDSNLLNLNSERKSDSNILSAVQSNFEISIILGIIVMVIVFLVIIFFVK